MVDLIAQTPLLNPHFGDNTQIRFGLISLTVF